MIERQRSLFEDGDRIQKQFLEFHQNNPEVYQNFGEDRAIHGGDESAATAQSLSRLRLNVK